MTDEQAFATKVRAKVRSIPYGRVASYGDIAALVGQPRAARGVGHVLSRLPQGSDVPWWRVVNARGQLSLHGFPGGLQRMMLEQEGVRFERAGGIDLRKYRWTPRQRARPASGARAGRAGRPRQKEEPD